MFKISLAKKKILINILNSQKTNKSIVKTSQLRFMHNQY